MTTASQSLRKADQLAASPYAWPGGYPMFALLNDGACLCKDCAKSERESIGTTTGSDGWTISTLAINWENSELNCDNCGNLIESAYGQEAES